MFIFPGNPASDMNIQTSRYPTFVVNQRDDTETVQLMSLEQSLQYQGLFAILSTIKNNQKMNSMC